MKNITMRRTVGKIHKRVTSSKNCHFKETRRHTSAYLILVVTVFALSLIGIAQAAQTQSSEAERCNPIKHSLESYTIATPEDIEGVTAVEMEEIGDALTIYFSSDTNNNTNIDCVDHVSVYRKLHTALQKEIVEKIEHLKKTDKTIEEILSENWLQKLLPDEVIKNITSKEELRKTLSRQAPGISVAKITKTLQKTALNAKKAQSPENGKAGQDAAPSNKPSLYKAPFSFATLKSVSDLHGLLAKNRPKLDKKDTAACTNEEEIKKCDSKNKGTAACPDKDKIEKCTDKAKKFGDYHTAVLRQDILRSTLTAMQSVEQQRIATNGKLSFSLTGNESGDEDSYTPSFGGEITIGSYPSQVRFSAETSLKYEKNTQSESVNDLNLSYDHYISPTWETFAFLERFSSSYLGIDDRYELGFGVEFERNRQANFFGEKEKWDTPLDQYDIDISTCKDAYTATGCQDMRKLSRAIKDYENISNVPPLSPQLKKTLSNYLRKKHSRFEWGLSAALLVDFEDATPITSTLKDGDGNLLEGETETFEIPGDERLRLSLRPSIAWKKGVFSIDAETYFKQAIESPIRVDGKLDYRVDSKLNIGWSLANVFSDGKAVGLNFTITHRYDSVPPSINRATEQLATLEAAGKFAAESGTAEKSHTKYNLSLSINF